MNQELVLGDQNFIPRIHSIPCYTVREKFLRGLGYSWLERPVDKSTKVQLQLFKERIRRNEESCSMRDTLLFT